MHTIACCCNKAPPSPRAHTTQARATRWPADTACNMPTILTLAAAVATEALVTGGHQEADAAVREHTLLHGETLLVLAAHDLEDVALQDHTKSRWGQQAVRGRSATGMPAMHTATARDPACQSHASCLPSCKPHPPGAALGHYSADKIERRTQVLPPQVRRAQCAGDGGRRVWRSPLRQCCCYPGDEETSCCCLQAPP